MKWIVNVQLYTSSESDCDVMSFRKFLWQHAINWNASQKDYAGMLNSGKEATLLLQFKLRFYAQSGQMLWLKFKH